MKKLAILGAGESGIGAALLGKQQGFDVFVSDKDNITHKYKNILIKNQIAFEEQNHDEERILETQIVVKSPGIPEEASIVKKLITKKIPVISEIEFAYNHTDAKIIAITGSNGKTTTTMLTYHLLLNGGLNVGIAGNIGDSFAKMVAKKKLEYYVIEVSSFQLDGIQNFRPHIAVILNITPDHLNRYEGDFEKYVKSKFRITKNQIATDHLIYDAEDKIIAKALNRYATKANLVPFSIKKEINNGGFFRKGKIIVNINDTYLEMEADNLALEGKHNIKNSLAASMVARLLNIRKKTIRKCLESFRGVEHRLEKVLKIQHVQYFNDSKATNVNATYFALDSMTHPTVWIMGGVDKGNDYVPLMPLVREKVKAIICLGIDNHKIITTFQNIVDVIEETDNMQQAVKLAYNIAEKYDSVLLSPACASFDLFKNYQDRGLQFKAAVKQL